MERDTYIGPDVWTVPVVGAIVYPLLVQGFILSVQAYKANGVVASKVVLAAAALVLMGSVLAVPFVAFARSWEYEIASNPTRRWFAAFSFGFCNSTGTNGERVRRLRLGRPLTWAWYSGWGLVAMITFLVRKGSSSSSPVTWRDSTRLRKIHGFSALLLLTGFLALHLGNHLVALWTVQTRMMS